MNLSALKGLVMTLTLQGYIDLPAHVQTGGFDHAAVHRATHQLYGAQVLVCLAINDIY